MEGYKLHIIEKEEGFIPAGRLDVDERFFDFDSLVRMYGRKTVVDYLRSRYGSYAGKIFPEIN